MSSEQYIKSTEVLYFLDRLDRYTPMTAKFISMGKDITTLFTQQELIPVITEDFEPSDITRDRGLERAGTNSHNLRDYQHADNNHSIFWNDEFVHAVGRSITFWNLDDDLKNLLGEAFNINPTIGHSLIRYYLSEIIEDDTKFIEALSEYSDSKLMHWLDGKRSELPPTPDPNHYEESIFNAYYEVCNKIIFEPLSQTTEYNKEIQEILLKEISKGGSEGFRLKEATIRFLIRDIFPLNEKVEGYIQDGYKTIGPSDARRGAVYVGNINNVLISHIENNPLITQDIIDNSPLITNEARTGLYPTDMRNGMCSDFLTEGPHEKLHFESKTAYPQLSMGEIMVRMGYDKKTEEQAEIDSPSPQIFDLLCRQVSKTSSPKGTFSVFKVD